MTPTRSLVLSAICTLVVACNGHKNASPMAPTVPALSSPGQPKPQVEPPLGSMTITSLDNPFDCVLQSLKSSGAAPQKLKIDIYGSTARFYSQHFGDQDISGSITKSEAQYEFTAIATGYRWYGGSPPLPVRNGLCPQEYAEYVITYARFPVELVESTDRSISARIDLIVTAVAYSDTASEWVSYGETRVVGEIIRARTPH